MRCFGYMTRALWGLCPRPCDDGQSALWPPRSARPSGYSTRICKWPPPPPARASAPLHPLVPQASIAALINTLFRMCACTAGRRYECVYSHRTAAALFCIVSTRHNVFRQVGCWHFEQHEHEAVMIPAGCPHQVRNLRPCIKVGLTWGTRDRRCRVEQHRRSEREGGREAKEHCAPCRLIAAPPAPPPFSATRSA